MQRTLFHAKQCLGCKGLLSTGFHWWDVQGYLPPTQKWDGERIARRMIKSALIVEAHCVVCIGGFSDA